MTQVVMPTTLAAFAHWIGERMGLQEGARRPHELSKALQRAARETGAPSAQALAERLLAAAPNAPEVLLEIAPYLTVGETYFFRDAPLHAALEHTLLPERLAAAAGRPLHLWSAACSSGEEPYSLAITLQRMQAGAGHRILATDLNPRAIAAARARTYREWSLRALPAGQRAPWFAKTADARWQLRSDVAAQVDFEVHNLLDVAPPRAACGRLFDIILCRNVLIYLDLLAAARVIQRLLRQLVEGGWLVVAAVESFLVPTPPAEMVNLGDTIAFRLPVAGPYLGSEAFGSAALQGDDSGAFSTEGVPWPPDTAEVLLGWGGDARVATEMPGPASAGTVGAPTGSPNLRRPGQAVARPHAGIPEPPRDREATVTCHTDVSALYRAGKLLERQGDWAGAGESWRKVLYLDSSHLLAQVAMALWQCQRGKRHQGLQRLQRAATALAAWPPANPIPDGDGMTAAQLLVQVQQRIQEWKAHG